MATEQKLHGAELEVYKARLTQAWKGGEYNPVGLPPAGAYEAFGEVHSLNEWARLTGICKTSLWRYTQKGLTIEEACELRGVVYSRTR